jgi:CBS domain-containing protein
MVSPDADALDALGRMRRTGSSRLLVVERDRLVGMVSLKDLLRFLSLKIELEDAGPPAPELDGEFRLPDQPGRGQASEKPLHYAGNGRGYA